MNGEISGVPIITLAGISSLSDLLPELPTAGHSGSGACHVAGSVLLYDQPTIDQANSVQNNPNEAVTSQLISVLTHTNTTYLNFKDDNVMCSKTTQKIDQSSVSNLYQILTQVDPILLCAGGDFNNTVVAVTNHKDGESQSLTVRSGYGCVAKMIEGETSAEKLSEPTVVLSSTHEQQIKTQDNSTSEDVHSIKQTSPVVNCSALRLVRPKLSRASSISADNVEEVIKPANLVLPKLSKEDEYLLQKSFKSFVHDHPKRAEAMGIASSDSESDNQTEHKRSKFFRATEKERDDEKNRLKQLRRKRKHEDEVEQDKTDENKRICHTQGEKSSHVFVPKTLTRKIERKIVPASLKVDADELIESNTFIKFNRIVELILDNIEELNLNELEGIDRSAEIPAEILIPSHQIVELMTESAKLKSLGATHSVPVDKLVKILNILDLNIRDGSAIVPFVDEDEDEDEDKLWLDIVMKRVMRSVDACIIVMNILTSKNMSKRCYLDDVIESVSLFLRYHLNNTIYPSFDPVYKAICKNKDGYVGSMKKQRSYAHTVSDKNIVYLYNKVTELTAMLSELVQNQRLTDTTVLYISTLGVAPFFVENIKELQLTALKLVTNLFCRYENHRKLLLDDILTSIARLPSSKRSLRTYRLSNSNSHIQMLTALVLQLIQCVVGLPTSLLDKNDNVKNRAGFEETPIAIDRDVFIDQKYNMAMGTAHQFISVFLQKCGSKNEDIDFRPLFENFVQDLLTIVNTPEWPAAELILSLLGHVLRANFSDKSVDMPLRISSLDYLGVVSARLRRDAIQSLHKKEYIDSIIANIKAEEAREHGENSAEIESHHTDDPEVIRTIFLQKVLLDYLAVVGGGIDDQATMNARFFYICQWYRDAKATLKKQKRHRIRPTSKRKKNSRGAAAAKRRVASSESEDVDQDTDSDPETDADKAALFRAVEHRKDCLMAKILPFGQNKCQKSQVLSSHIDDESAQLIVRFLSSKRPFANSFDFYLADILKVLTEPSTQIRTKALKCLTLIVTEDPSVLLRQDIQVGVNYSFVDTSTMVREAAVDLVGRFILHKENLIDKYYTMITDRILDTGVSVRKRVIKIMKDICLEFPDYPRIPELCVKMIRRINDEEGIRKLVMEVFQNMWFFPITSPRGSIKNDAELLVTRARNITDVIDACYESGLEWFEQLLQTLFKPKECKENTLKLNTEASKQIMSACRQIVDCLVESMLRIEENSFSSNAISSRGVQHGRIAACLTTLYTFAKIRPELLVPHVQTLQPYLSGTCVTRGDYVIISNVAKTLELTVPLIKHPSEIFLSQLEEDSVKLILQHDKSVVGACLSCLGSIVNRVTKNYKLIRDCFTKYYGIMVAYRRVHEVDPNDTRLVSATAKFRRALYTVGLLLRHFDFSKSYLYEGLQLGSRTKEDVFETIFYFVSHSNVEIQTAALQSIGFVCIRHFNFMLGNNLKQLYIDILTQDFYSEQHKIKVLNNLETFLCEEEVRMIQEDSHWGDDLSREDLKEMNDVSSGTASTVIQIYLMAILDSFIHPSVCVRHAALKVIQLILSQGLVHPIQIVPYLICMSTDSEQKVSHTSDRELQDIEKKYPGFIHMKLFNGIRLSHKLQQIIQRPAKVVRGRVQNKEGDIPTALNGFLYSILKSTKAQRRAILLNFLKHYDESAKTSLSLMLYLADNLAYIPYTVIDEPLFVIHHIDIMISVSGSNLLQAFKEALRPPPNAEEQFNAETNKMEYIYDEDLDDDFECVSSRLPDDLLPLVQSITASQGCLLLLVLKEHLKDLYGITEGKIQSYTPSEASKIYEKPLHRRNHVKFNPKATIEILQMGDPPTTLSQQEKRELVSRYLKFKELMNKMDPDEDDQDDAVEDIEGGTPKTRVVNTNGSLPMPSPKAKTSLRQPSSRSKPAVVTPQYNSDVQQRFQQFYDDEQKKLKDQPSFTSHSALNHGTDHQSTARKPIAVVDGTGVGSEEEMILDPTTGELVPVSRLTGTTAEYENSNSTGSTIVLSNTNSRDKIPKLRINIGSVSSSKLFADDDNNSQRSSHRHHRRRSHSKRTKHKKHHHRSSTEHGRSNHTETRSDTDDSDSDFVA